MDNQEGDRMMSIAAEGRSIGDFDRPLGFTEQVLPDLPHISKLYA